MNCVTYHQHYSSTNYHQISHRHSVIAMHSPVGSIILSCHQIHQIPPMMKKMMLLLLFSLSCFNSVVCAVSQESEWVLSREVFDVFVNHKLQFHMTCTYLLRQSDLMTFVNHYMMPFDSICCR